MTTALVALSIASVAAPDAASIGAAEKPHPRIEMHRSHDAPADPLSIEIAYTADVMANTVGGARRGARYLDNLDVVIGADLDALVGWRGASIGLYGLYNNGRSICALVGDAQGVSNIETGLAAVRLYEAWIDQKIGDHVSLRAGLYDLNSEFDALDAASLFLGSGHGIGSDFGQSGRNGPSIFPSTSLAARLELRFAEGWALRAAVLDGVPGNPDRPARTAVHLGNGDGALLVGELEAPIAGGKFLLGHWRYSAAFDRIDGVGQEKGNAGAYVRAEFPVTNGPGRRIDAFGRFGIASRRFNDFGRFAAAGLTFSEWIPGRSEDVFGVAMAAAFTSPSLRQKDDAGQSEIALEATYRTPLAEWLSIQPSVQYVLNPSADPTIPSALVFGLRTEISFSL